jgi:hypothetical protein
MKKAFWFITGIAAGLIAAEQLKNNPKAKAIADDVVAKVRELGDVAAEGFREREAEIAAAKKPDATNPAATKAAPKPASNA